MGVAAFSNAFSTAYLVPVLYDAASNSGEQLASSSYSWSHTCSGSNRFLSVDISMYALAGAITVTGITYNGMAMSLIGTRSSTILGERVECWGLVAPATGSHTIAVTLSGIAAGSVGMAVSYQNVHQTSSTEAFNSEQGQYTGGLDPTPGVSVTTVADNALVHAGCSVDVDSGDGPPFGD